jgi:hypothetical protein
MSLRRGCPMRSLKLRASERERFAARIAPCEPAHCWPWRGATSRDGYGVVRLGRGRRRRLVYAHRLAYALAFGSPGRLQILHTCDVPACCNPMHLRAGTQRDNVHDMIAKGRAGWQR